MKLHRAFQHSSSRVPPTVSSSLHHNKHEPSQSLEAVWHHPTELHGRAHGRQVVVNGPHCAAQRSDRNTCLQPPGNCFQCSSDCSWVFLFNKKKKKKCCKRITKEIPFVSLSVETKGRTVRAGGASLWMQCPPSAAQRTDSAVLLRASNPQTGE